jgi:hypothetical protein
MECQRLERNSFERVEGTRINSENIQNTGELFWVTTRQERERDRLCRRLLSCLFLFCFFVFLVGFYYLGSLRRQRLERTHRKEEK